MGADCAKEARKKKTRSRSGLVSVALIQLAAEEEEEESLRAGPPGVPQGVPLGAGPPSAPSAPAQIQLMEAGGTAFLFRSDMIEYLTETVKNGPLMQKYREIDLCFNNAKM